MPHDPVELGREVIAACRALGFALVGITPARRTDREHELRDWLAAGKHGTMAWMEELLEERLDPARMLPGATAIVMVADIYSAGGAMPRMPGLARIARYAQGRDYHVVMKRRLHRLADALRTRFPGREFRSFVDTGPVLEREHAARAGLGWIGKHTLLIHPRHGSYLLLGGMVTTLELAPVRDIGAPELISDSCGSCTRCIDACPTRAITPYSVDARRCISYLTIEHPGTIDAELAAKTGDWLFGCDVCQEVCPFNRALDAGDVQLAYRGTRDDAGRERAAGLSIVKVLEWGREEHDAAVRGTSMKRAKLGMLKRNAVLAAGHVLEHGNDAEIEASVRRAASDAGMEPEAREAAQALLARRARAI